MQRTYYVGNRERLYQRMDAGSLLAVFSGEELWKTSDEYYPFFADRNFVYLTGMKCRSTVLLAAKNPDGSVQERLYLLPPDALAERWTGARVKPEEAEAISGVSDVRTVQAFERDFSTLAAGGNYGKVYLDLYRFTPEQPDRPSHRLLRRVQRDFAYLAIGNAEDIPPFAAPDQAALRNRSAAPCGVHHA